MLKVKEGGSPHMRRLNIGEFGSAGVLVVLTYFIIQWMLPESWTIGDRCGRSCLYRQRRLSMQFWPGLGAGLLIGKGY